jgi:hypothetical protein
VIADLAAEVVQGGGADDRSGLRRSALFEQSRHGLSAQVVEDTLGGHHRQCFSGTFGPDQSDFFEPERCAPQAAELLIDKGAGQRMFDRGLERIARSDFDVPALVVGGGDPQRLAGGAVENGRQRHALRDVVAGI